MAKLRNGFTLIELLSTLFITSIFTAIALPSYTRWVAQSLTQATQLQLYAALYEARNNAILYSTYTTFCFTVDGMSCSQQKTKTMMLFIDRNKNEKIDHGDHLIRQIRLSSKVQVNPKLSLGKYYVQFRPVGLANGTAGSLQICPDQYTEKLRRAVIISFSGRIQNTQDRDGDGIHDLSKGTSVPFCK